MLEQFKKGLHKTREAFKGRLDNLFKVKEITPDFYEELEEVLISADVGVATSLKLIDQLREQIQEQKIKEGDAAREKLKTLLVELLQEGGGSELHFPEMPPCVYLILGVNGVGKTTTIAKMAYYYTQKNKKVLLAAGDTFRAAAIDQLSQWSIATGVDLIKHHPGGDPSAVIYDAVNAAVARKSDLLLCDTAGRLHTKSNLLDEIKKMNRTIGKVLPGAPHETLLVLDATTGHNGIAQARLFHEAIPLTGIVLTKLDGTARGGIVIAVKDMTGIPVKLVGTGEKKEDLQPFDPHAFAEALLS